MEGLWGAHDFWQFLGTLVLGLPAIIFAFKAWRASEKTHGAVNGRMDEFKELMQQNADMARQIEALRKTQQPPQQRKDDEKPVVSSNVPGL